MILSGKPVAQALCRRMHEDAQLLGQQGVTPTLCVVRLGEDPADLSYERGICNRAGQVGVEARKRVLPPDTEAAALIDVIHGLNMDREVHGVLLFRPLPAHLRDRQSEIFNALDPAKDVDGMTDGSAAGVFLGTATGFAPCTPSACMQVLDHYGIDPRGKRTVVIGRSPVVGKPLAMLLLARHATVTVCHTRTEDLAAEASRAELLIACAGSAGLIGADCIAPGAIVLDVGVNWCDGKYVGDVRFEEAEPIAGAITPVPGGVGAVTTAMLLRNVVTAAMRQTRREA